MYEIPQSIKTLADDAYPFEKINYEETVPQLLEPDEEKGEELDSYDR